MWLLFPLLFLSICYMTEHVWTYMHAVKLLTNGCQCKVHLHIIVYVSLDFWKEKETPKQYHMKMKNNILSDKKKYVLNFVKLKWTVKQFVLVSFFLVILEKGFIGSSFPLLSSSVKWPSVLKNKWTILQYWQNLLLPSTFSVINVICNYFPCKFY